MTLTADDMKALRRPFADSEIGYLPRGQARIPFVGHAAVTNRLLEVDPAYEFEPIVRDELGLPATRTDKQGQMHAAFRLTVKGVTHPEIGVGTTYKTLTSDGLKRCAMRFGVALDLWSKEELEHGEVGADATQGGFTPEPEPPPEPEPEVEMSPAARLVAVTLDDLDDATKAWMREWWKAEHIPPHTSGRFTDEHAELVLAKIAEIDEAAEADGDGSGSSREVDEPGPAPSPPQDREGPADEKTTAAGARPVDDGAPSKPRPGQPEQSPGASKAWDALNGNESEDEEQEALL